MHSGALADDEAYEANRGGASGGCVGWDSATRSTCSVTRTIMLLLLAGVAAAVVTLTLARAGMRLAELPVIRAARPAARSAATRDVCGVQLRPPRSARFGRTRRRFHNVT